MFSLQNKLLIDYRVLQNLIYATDTEIFQSILVGSDTRLQEVSFLRIYVGKAKMYNYNIYTYT